MATGFPFVKWSDADHARFLDMLTSGDSPQDVADALGRSIGAIESRRRKVMASEIEKGASPTDIAAAFHVDVKTVEAAVAMSKATPKAKAQMDIVASAISGADDREYLEDIIRRARARLAVLADLGRGDPVRAVAAHKKCLFGRVP